MSNIVISDPARMQVMSDKITKSGLFGIKNVNQVYSLLMLAESEGLHPMTAMKQYHIVNGRPTLKSSETLARFQKSGGLIKWIKSTEDEAEAELTHPQGGSITIKWDITKAKKAGIFDKNPTWKTYPSNMLRARVITDGVNAIYPACLGGNMPETVAEDLPVDDEIEEVEVETVNINDLKKSLGRKLEKHGVVSADIKAFATKYNLTEDTELLSELVEDEEKLLKYIGEFEDEM